MKYDTPSQPKHLPRDARERLSSILTKFNKAIVEQYCLSDVHGGLLVQPSGIGGYASSDLVSTADAARLLTLAPKTLENWRCKGNGPQFSRVGGRVVYQVGDLMAYVQSNSVPSTPLCARRGA